MFSGDECRARAELARVAALATDDPSAKAVFAETAKGWLELAARADSQAAIGADYPSNQNTPRPPEVGPGAIDP
jgi:hypothetical protein